VSSAPRCKLVVLGGSVAFPRHSSSTCLVVPRFLPTTVLLPRVAQFLNFLFVVWRCAPACLWTCYLIHLCEVSDMLNCLHKLQADNRELEGVIRNLTARRDHLLSVIARLSSRPNPTPVPSSASSPVSPLHPDHGFLHLFDRHIVEHDDVGTRIYSFFNFYQVFSFYLNRFPWSNGLSL